VIEYLAAYILHSLEMRKQVRKFRPDVIVGLGLLDAFSGIRQARRARVPFVYYLIDELHRLVPEPALRGLARVVEQANVRRASLVLSINRSLQEYTIEMGAPPERTKVLPAGVDLDRYAATTDGSDARRRLGLDASDLVLLFMGWVYPFSGLREVAESIIAGEGQEFRTKLAVIGKGDAWEEIERIAKRDEADGRIKMVGFRPYEEMPSFLAAADVGLLPARDVETMRNIVPIKMYEYLAAGKPVIATRLPGLEKEFGEDHGVVYVDGPEQVVKTAVELARKGLLRALGNKGRAFVSGLDWKSITDAFESDLIRLSERRAAVE
jgi:glycosyltransferase involved in cell wall biosynthesis